MADLSAELHSRLTGEDEGRVCRDIPEAACNDQPKNFSLHIASLAATKTGDGLVDPKLVLAWIMQALGAPHAAIGMLVPVREAGALLPQLFTAAAIRARPIRKTVWAAGALLQGACAIGMAGVALTLEGAAAGWAMIGLLAIFAIARSVCSVAYKDVLGKTVAKKTRGTATGTANSVAAALVFAFGVGIAVGIIPLTVAALSVSLCVAGALWFASCLFFLQLEEVPGATEGGGNGFAVAMKQLSHLRQDPQLVRFIAVRGLLIATALAPPYMLALGGEGGGKELGRLGSFVIASALASILSSYVWGRLSDLSSRKVLILSGLVGAAACGTVAGLAALAPAQTDLPALLPGLLFVLMIGYQGVRLGRSTHLTDMANAETRAAYTALSNTIIGLLLLLGGLFGLVADAFGAQTVLALFALMCLGASGLGLGLNEVQADAA